MKLFIFAFTLLPILTYAAPIGTNTRQQLVKKSESVNVHARSVQHYARQADANAQRPEDDADGEEESPAAQQANATATAKATDTKLMEGTATAVADVQSTGVEGGKSGSGKSGSGKSGSGKSGSGKSGSGKGGKGGKGGIGAKNRQQEVDGTAKNSTKTDDPNAPFETVICQPCPPGAICKMDCIPYTITVTPDANAAKATNTAALNLAGAKGKAGGAKAKVGAVDDDEEVEGAEETTTKGPVETATETAKVAEETASAMAEVAEEETATGGGAGPQDDD